MELIPRQLRSMNTRPQQSGRTLKPANRLKQRFLKNLEICRDAIGYRTFQMIPDPFIGIQFRRISRESKGTNFRMFFKPLLSPGRPVRHAAIPEQNKTFGQMPLEMLQEFDHLRPTDVLLRMQPDVKINPFMLWRYADGRNRRNLTPTSSRDQNRRLSFGRPSPSYRRNQRKAALVKKHDGNSSFQSVFLYAAIGIFSSEEPPAHLSPAPCLQVSDNSSLIRSRLSRHVSDDTQLLNADLLPLQSFASSITQLNIRSSALLATESRPTVYAAFHSAFLAALAPLLILILLLLVLDTASATYTQNLPNILVSLLPPTFLIRSLATQSRAGAAFQAAFGFHVVSCHQINTSLNQILLLLRKSIVDLSGLDIIFKIITLIILGILFLGVSYIYNRFSIKGK